MNGENLTENWQEKAQELWLNHDYLAAEKLYELGIELEPENLSYYGNLGLLFLLQGQEMEAQTTWLMGMDLGGEEVEVFTEELRGILTKEAQRQEGLGDYSLAWVIRQHLREIVPEDWDNFWRLVGDSTELNLDLELELKSLEVVEILQSELGMNGNIDLFLEVLEKIFKKDLALDILLELTEASLDYMKEVDQAKTLMKIVVLASFRLRESALDWATRLLEIVSRLDSDQFEPLVRLAVLHPLVECYQTDRNYEKAIKLAKFCCSICQEVGDKIIANQKLLNCLMEGVIYREEVKKLMEEQELLFHQIIVEQPRNLASYQVLRLICTTYFLPYYEDRAVINRKIHNQIGELCQKNIKIYAENVLESYRQKHQLTQQNSKGEKRRLKIGYLSYCLQRHSVGWLARWLFYYHDQEKFHIHAYFLVDRPQPIPDPLKTWYLEHTETVRRCGSQGMEIAEQIAEDGIDILVDLDSLTLDVSCEILSLKPAPIQVTWLGWDGSGIPSVDYFIADPYVLPECAQDYYREKIWRLPETYIAVDGFETDIPSLRREDFGIKSDAIIYYSSQISYKRHPHTVRLQMKILARVSGSYFLIKGGVYDDAVKNFFYEIAEQEGVELDRLKFLPKDPTESTHRANLMLADVVLDTYPYNGATTTLETLWMGIPLVTKVGEQFSARNSYTMMINAGITEGIAWTDEEYIDWGVRLGMSAELRSQVHWKLRKSRAHSPLWNGKKFAQEMENAYEKMWEIFLNNG